MSPNEQIVEVLEVATGYARDGDLGQARFYLAEADFLMAAAEQRLATEPQPFPAPVSALLSDAVPDTGDEGATLPAPSRRCLRCDAALADAEDDLCEHCCPKGDAS